MGWNYQLGKCYPTNNEGRSHAAVGGGSTVGSWFFLDINSTVEWCGTGYLEMFTLHKNVDTNDDKWRHTNDYECWIQKPFQSKISGCYSMVECWIWHKINQQSLVLVRTKDMQPFIPCGFLLGRQLTLNGGRFVSMFHPDFVGRDKWVALGMEWSYTWRAGCWQPEIR